MTRRLTAVSAAIILLVLCGLGPVWAASDTYEPDNTFPEAKAITTDGVTQYHTFDPAGDEDWVKFDATSGTTYRIATMVSTGTDTVLYLMGTDGTTQLGYNDDSGPGRASLIWWTCPADGTYFVRSYEYYGNLGEYTILVKAGGSAVAPLDIYEPDNSLAEAKPIATDGTPQMHLFEPAGESDFVTFTATAGRLFRFTLDQTKGPDPGGSGAGLFLYDAGGLEIASRVEDYAAQVQLEWACPADGTYFLEARDTCFDESSYELTALGNLLAVSGTVSASDPPSDPSVLGYVECAAYDAQDGSWLAYFYPDASANYQYQVLLTPGSYKFRCESWNQVYVPEWYNDKGDFASADAITVVDGPVTGIDLALDPVGRLSGSVTGVLTPAEVGLGCFYLNAVRISDRSVNSLRLCDVNATADFSLALPKGEYRLKFVPDKDSYSPYAFEWYQDANVISQATRLTVQSGVDTTGVNLQVGLAGSISGTITPPAGDTLSEQFTVRVVDALSGDYLARMPVDASTNYSYTIHGLPAGPVKVRLLPASGSVYAAEYYDDADAFSEAQPIGVTPNTVRSGVDFSLDRLATIRGTITGLGGEPLQDVYVSASGGTSRSDSTDATGAYSITVRPGTYRIYLEPTGAFAEEYMPEWHHRRLTEENALPVTVEAGGTATVDCQLAARGENIAPEILTDSAFLGEEGVELTFTLQAVDFNGDTLIFSSGSLPAGAVLDPATGAFRWTPGYDQAGVWAIPFSVSDGLLSAGRTISVTVSDHAPLFAETFADGTGRVDYDWALLKGRWVVDRAQRYASSPLLGGTALIAAPAVRSFANGRIEASLTLTARAAGAPNAWLLFGYRTVSGVTSYRYVKITRKKIFLKDSNRIGTFAPFTFALKRAYKLTVDVSPGGAAEVAVDGVKVLSYTFPGGEVEGMIGVKAVKAKSYADDIAIWDVIP